MKKVQGFDVSVLIKHKGLYVYVWERDGQILYVGQSRTLVSRLSTHGVIDRAESLQPSDKIDLYQCDSIEEMMDLEEDLILKFRPKYNKQKSLMAEALDNMKAR